jgi:CDP-diacylglycerol---glycerol-3-phosphate 3-phosphatidyltransferase
VRGSLPRQVTLSQTRTMLVKISMSLIHQLKSPYNVLNLANLLTIARILLIPFMALLLEFDAEQIAFEKDWMFRYSPGRVAAFVVIIMGITDILDGYFARKWKIDSLLGKFLDPVADKLVLLVGLIMLMKLQRVDAWLVMVLLSREFLITALRAIAAGEGLIIAASQSGKWKLTLQMLGLGLLMWYGSVFGVPAVTVGTWILYIALFISLLSGWHYLRDFFVARKIKRTREIG